MAFVSPATAFTLPQLNLQAFNEFSLQSQPVLPSASSKTKLVDAPQKRPFFSCRPAFKATQTRLFYVTASTPDVEAPNEAIPRSVPPAAPTTEVLKGDAAAFMKRLEDKQGKLHVCQIAPSTFGSISEEFGLAPGTVTAGQLVLALRKLGYDYVFDTRFGADMTIVEEAAELVERLHEGGTFPMFTSCCAAWMQLAEKNYSDLLPHLSTAKSPMSELSAVLKSYFPARLGRQPSDIIVGFIGPCITKKAEAKRPQLVTTDDLHLPTTDYAVTTRELGAMFRYKGINPAELDPKAEGTEFDALTGAASGAGAIFGVTGGVMEAALRTAYELLTKERLGKIEVTAVRGFECVREAAVPVGVGGVDEIRVCVVHGTQNVRKLLEQVRSGECPYHFIEVMACEGGCIGGAGQPKSNDKEILKKRAAALYSSDERNVLRTSHENPVLRQLYDEFLDQHHHELLHTSFSPVVKEAKAPISEDSSDSSA